MTLGLIIPHTWKLASIIPIPKPNKDINICTSYRPISLLSVIAKQGRRHYYHTSHTLYHTSQKIPHISTQHGFKSGHSTNITSHTINNTIATGFNQYKPAERTVAVALDMSKVFDTVIIHTLTHKLHQTNIPHTILKLHRRPQSIRYIQK